MFIELSSLVCSEQVSSFFSCRSLYRTFPTIQMHQLHGQNYFIKNMHNDKFLCIMQLFSQHNIHPYLTTVINATGLSCMTHQLNIIKCITKQYHEMTIEYLSFIRFMGRLLLDPSTSSSSSFMTSSFLIQMIRWIIGSSRIEFFIFLIT